MLPKLAKKARILCLATIIALLIPSVAPSPVDFYQYYHYRDFEKIVLYFNSFREAKVVVIGKSWQNRSIYAIFVGDVSKKPIVLIVGGHHGREHISAQFPLYFAWLLLTNESARKLLDYYSFIIVPLLNPDGYEVAFTNPWQRKNCRPVDDDGDGLVDEDPPQDIDGDNHIAFYRNKTCAWFEGIDDDKDGKLNEDWIGGVDLNRNYPFMWNKGIRVKESLQYRGPYPLSEPETKALVSLIEKYKYSIVLAVSYHSGARLVLYPWSYSKDPPPNEDLFKEICLVYSNITGYRVLQSSRLYLSFGEFMDYMLHEYQIIAITVEIYGYFANYTWHKEHTYRIDSIIVFKDVYEYFNPPPGKELAKVLKVNAVALQRTLLYYKKYIVKEEALSRDVLRIALLLSLILAAAALTTLILDARKYYKRKLFK